MSRGAEAPGTMTRSRVQASVTAFVLARRQGTLDVSVMHPAAIETQDYARV